MVRQYHQLKGRKSEQTPGDSEAQGSLVCWGPQGHEESDMTQQLNNFIQKNLRERTVRADNFLSSKEQLSLCLRQIQRISKCISMGAFSWEFDNQVPQGEMIKKIMIVPKSPDTQGTAVCSLSFFHLCICIDFNFRITWESKLLIPGPSPHETQTLAFLVSLSMTLKNATQYHWNHEKQIMIFKIQIWIIHSLSYCLAQF